MTQVLHCRRDPAARLLVSGPDAATFLQGQFTHDLRSPRGSGQACTYGLWLNQKGRVLADSFVLARGPERFEVVSLASPVATIRDRLDAYIIADDVTVEEVTTPGEGWIISGELAAATAALAKLGLPTPAVGEFAASGELVVFRARAAGGPNWLVLSPPGGIEETRLHEVSRGVTRDELALARIENGVPEIPAELGPGDLPQEGGLEADAISFTKGCYLGQEVMARLHNMGQVRRRLHIVRCAPQMSAGVELFLGDRRVGEMRAVAPSGTDAVGLAMLHTAHVQPGAALAASAGGAPSVNVLRVAEGRAW